MALHDDTILEVERLQVVYHRVALAVQGVSLKVPDRSVVALVGTNGAGKTTVLRAIAGFLPAEDAEVVDGFIRFQSRDITGWRPHDVTRLGVVLVPERHKVFETMSVEQNLRVASGSTDRRSGSLDMVYHFFPVLRERRKALAGYLSGGERQMLCLGSALLLRPKVLLVDELSLGLAPLLVTALLEHLRRLRDELGTSILLVEQNAAAALAIADYGYVIENGRIVLEGPAQKLRLHEDVREFYLGLGSGEEARSYREVKQYRRKRRWFG